MWLVSSPIPGQEGKSFDELARAAGRDPLDFFMDLMAEHDTAIRWKTVVTNDRDEQRHFLFAHDTALPGFNDSGRMPATWPSRTADCKCCSRCKPIRR